MQRLIDSSVAPWNTPMGAIALLLGKGAPFEGLLTPPPTESGRKEGIQLDRLYRAHSGRISPRYPRLDECELSPLSPCTGNDPDFDGPILYCKRQTTCPLFRATIRFYSMAHISSCDDFFVLARVVRYMELVQGSAIEHTRLMNKQRARRGPTLARRRARKARP